MGGMNYVNVLLKVIGLFFPFDFPWYLNIFGNTKTFSKGNILGFNRLFIIILLDGIGKVELSV